MSENYRIEEDVLFNMKWEVGNLLKEGKTIEVILSWEDSCCWHNNIRNILRNFEVKLENIKHDTGDNF